MSSDYTETGRAESIIVLSDGRMCISECTRGKYVLRIIDENGKTVSSVSPCSENDEVLTGIACAGQDGEIYFVQKADTEKGKMIKVSVFDESGNIRRETDITDNAENIFVKGVFGSEGSDFLIYELNTSESIESFASEIDYGNGTLKKGIMEGICGICENAEGNLWFYTNDGVYDYDKDTFSQAVQKIDHIYTTDSTINGIINEQLSSLLFIIPGIIKSYEYRMVAYILADQPELTRKEAFELSRKMMNGNKWNAFVLDLSFIGWGFLTAITFGILGIFYVNPYIQHTNAALYLKLKEVNCF